MIIFGLLGKDKDGAAVPADNAQRVVRVEGVRVGLAHTANGAGKAVFHEPRVGIHRVVHDGAEQPLDGQQLGRRAHAAGGRVAKELLPGLDIVRGTVGFHGASSDPERMATGAVRIRHHVTRRSQQTANGAMDGLVGGIGVGC